METILTLILGLQKVKLVLRDGKNHGAVTMNAGSALWNYRCKMPYVNFTLDLQAFFVFVSK